MRKSGHVSQVTKLFWFLSSEKNRLPRQLQICRGCTTQSRAAIITNFCAKDSGKAKVRQQLFVEKSAQTSRRMALRSGERMRQNAKVFCFFSSEKKTFLILSPDPTQPTSRTPCQAAAMVKRPA
jgi:hypothetical protein